MDYSLYEPEDFAADESYLRYYFKLDQEDIRLWQGWISIHPEKLDVIISADQLISLMALRLPEEEFQQELERITHAISTDEEPVTIMPAPSQSRFLPWRAVAAVAVLIIITTAIFYTINHSSVTTRQLLLSKTAQQKIHTAEGPLKIELEDGSIITLKEGAQLTYPDHFGAQAREVQLDGEAFFEVGKDATRPFYVYYDNLVTHALGTSFNIRSNKQKKQIEVAVHSGKVEVYERPAEQKDTGPAAGNGIILTPNQKVVYTEHNRQFEALVVEKPLPLEPDSVVAPDSAPVFVQEDGFVFNAVALPVILTVFERVYGIEISVENGGMEYCHFSGDISNMDFNARLEVICQAINATYEVRGTSILIRGKGCR